MLATSKVMANVGFGHSSDFPSAIEMFEALPGESRFGLITENQVSLGQRGVPAEVPALADLEVTQQVRRYVRSEWNAHQRIEKLFRVFEVGIDSRQIEKSELGKLPKQREVDFEMVHEFSEVCFGPVDIGKRHHGRRGIAAEKHRKLIDEIADGGLGSSLSVIDLRGKELIRDFQLSAEKADFFRLGFKVPMPLVQENEIEHCDAPLYVFDFVLAAVADVLAIDLAVEAAGEQVIDGSALWKALSPGVAFDLKFVPEESRALAPMGFGEGEKLARYKVAGMRRYDVEKPGLRFGVPESF